VPVHENDLESLTVARISWDCRLESIGQLVPTKLVPVLSKWRLSSGDPARNVPPEHEPIQMEQHLQLRTPLQHTPQKALIVTYKTFPQSLPT
jgi:hypothetical protein